MQTDFIIVSEYCRKCHIDPSFILLLEDNGLIDIREEENEQYLLSSQLHDLEKYTRWYYDLSINIEGIDAIRHLLERMDALQHELNNLKRRLDIYRHNDPSDTEMKE